MKTFLNDMIAVRVLNQYNDVRLKRHVNRLHFVLSLNTVNDLLDSTSPVDVHAHCDKVFSDASQDLLSAL